MTTMPRVFVQGDRVVINRDCASVHWHGIAGTVSKSHKTRGQEAQVTVQCDDGRQRILFEGNLDYA